MIRTEFEKYLGQNVEIDIFDGTIIQGILHKTGEEIFKNNANLYIPRNYYFCVDDNGESVACLFRVSHVKKLQEWTVNNVDNMPILEMLRDILRGKENKDGE